MILRHRPKPLPLEKYERLIPRLSPKVPGIREIHAEADRRLKGYVGEKNTDYHTSLLASQFSILYDVGLKIQGKTVQFDTLILTPHAIFPVESKNFSGVITFDTILKQLIRDNGKTEKGYRYPITQVELQKMKLQLWLQQHNLAHIPIYPLVAISDPATVVKVIGDQESIAKMVFHAEYIPKQIMDMEEQLKGEEINHYKIARLILKECVEFDRDVMDEHGIRPGDLHRGVKCPSCKMIGIKRVHGAWKCDKCQNKYPTAHKQALEDYFLLVKSSISNEECMKWLKLTSRHAAKRILQNSHLIYNSSKKTWNKNLL